MNISFFIKIKGYLPMHLSPVEGNHGQILTLLWWRFCWYGDGLPEWLFYVGLLNPTCRTKNNGCQGLVSIYLFIFFYFFFFFGGGGGGGQLTKVTNHYDMYASHWPIGIPDVLTRFLNLEKMVYIGWGFFYYPWKSTSNNSSVRASVCPPMCLSHLFHNVLIIVSSSNFQ